MATSIFRISPSISYAIVDFPKLNLHSLSLRQRRRRILRCAPPDSGGSVGAEVSLSIGSYAIPHPNKVEKGGEDAFFVSSYRGGVIAVADGVSGWAEQNVNPALFSQELIANAYSFLEHEEEVNYDPRILIKKAHAATSSIGSATVIVAMLERSGVLKIASVGDCGVRVVREGEIIFSTSPQEHYFDCPYQLSSESIGQTYLDATLSSVEVKEEDIIVMGSDGLFDNVFDHEIVSVLAAQGDVSNAAMSLADLAHSHSLDPKFDSPYSREARERGFGVPWWKKMLQMKLTGGKRGVVFWVIKSFVHEEYVVHCFAFAL